MDCGRRHFLSVLNCCIVARRTGAGVSCAKTPTCGLEFFFGARGSPELGRRIRASNHYRLAATANIRATTIRLHYFHQRSHSVQFFPENQHAHSGP
jgi:hypothetical protein